MNTSIIRNAIKQEANGERFEDFCKAYCTRKYGQQFRPVGGKKDGGRDGIYIRPDKTACIFQFSIEQRVKGKIIKTIQRLQEFLTSDEYNKFKELRYITNQVVNDAEKIEEELERDYGKRLKIHDLNWIIANMGSEDGTISVVNDYYLQEKEPLHEIKISREVYVFFSMMTSNSDEIIDHSLDLRERALGALILQELRDTSSEKRMSRSELLYKMIQSCPWVKERMITTALARLNTRHSKKHSVRLINWHKKEDEICLPYESACEVKSRRNEANALCDYVANKVNDFLSELRELKLKPTERDRAWPIIQEYLAKIFTTRGSEILEWIDTREYKLRQSDLDLLRATLDERNIQGKNLFRAYQYVLARLFESRSDEKILTFLSRLNEAYLLHLVSGRDVKVHGVLANMRRGLTLICCSSILLPQIVDYITTGENSILQSAQMAGIKIKTTEAFLEEVRYQLCESLKHDGNSFSISNEFTTLAKSKGKTVEELFLDIGLQMPMLGNLPIVLKSLFGLEIIKIPTASSEIRELANALMPYRKNQRNRALADASAFYYIKDRQLIVRNNYQTWWLTRETATVKVAIDRNIPVDKHIYMRLSFLQDILLLLPNNEELETKPGIEWARDTILLTTPTDALPEELVAPYRRVKEEFERSPSQKQRAKLLEKMHAFMSLGAADDKSDS